MTDELMEQRIAELNAHRTENTPVFNSEKRTYSVDDIMSILDISRSSAYILIKKDFFSECQNWEPAPYFQSQL